ncbi:hypothetical protein [Streptomyces flavofungini]|uniref:hypothetical protein n=1 Tax=Streptomyces flavofungini TaxID=68200 RepID=UPI0034DE4AB3
MRDRDRDDLVQAVPSRLQFVGHGLDTLALDTAVGGWNALLPLEAGYRCLGSCAIR